MSKDAAPELPDPDLKIILLGDSAVGKSKLIERFLMDEYNPRQVANSYSSITPSLIAHTSLLRRQLSTFALTLFRKEVQLNDDDGRKTIIGKCWTSLSL
jgi:Rab-like protein 2